MYRSLKFFISFKNCTPTFIGQLKIMKYLCGPKTLISTIFFYYSVLSKVIHVLDFLCASMTFPISDCIHGMLVSQFDSQQAI